AASCHSAPRGHRLSGPIGRTRPRRPTPPQRSSLLRPKLQKHTTATYEKARKKHRSTMVLPFNGQGWPASSILKRRTGLRANAPVLSPPIWPCPESFSLFFYVRFTFVW